MGYGWGLTQQQQQQLLTLQQTQQQQWNMQRWNTPQLLPNGFDPGLAPGAIGAMMLPPGGGSGGSGSGDSLAASWASLGPDPFGIAAATPTAASLGMGTHAASAAMPVLGGSMAGFSSGILLPSSGVSAAGFGGVSAAQVMYPAASAAGFGRFGPMQSLLMSDVLPTAVPHANGTTITSGHQGKGML
jgi:hypothetical protein